MEKITADQLSIYGPIVQMLFRSAYPDGLTMDQLREKAHRHGYLRRILAALEQEGR